MTIDQLQTIKIIVESGSFRAASEKLNKAQSAVSYSVSQLEDQLGFSLFDRSKYRPQLTPSGEAVYQQALKILRESNNLIEMSSWLRLGHESKLELSLAAIVSIDRICLSMKNFDENFPATRVTVTSDVLGADRRLILGETDLAIAESFALNSEIESVPFTKVEMLPVIAQNHPLAESIQDVKDSKIRSLRQVVVKSSSGGEDRTAGVLNAARAWRVSEFSSKLSLIKNGLGWGRMPRHLISDLVDKKELKVLKDFSKYEVPIYLSRHRSRHKGPAAEFLWNQIIELADD